MSRAAHPVGSWIMGAPCGQGNSALQEPALAAVALPGCWNWAQGTSLVRRGNESPFIALFLLMVAPGCDPARAELEGGSNARLQCTAAASRRGEVSPVPGTASLPPLVLLKPNYCSCHLFAI